MNFWQTVIRPHEETRFGVLQSTAIQQLGSNFQVIYENPWARLSSRY
jgi:hypothetical protein